MPKFAVRRYLECGEKRQSHPILCPRFGFKRTTNSRRPSPSSQITDKATAGSRLPASFGAAPTAVKSLRHSSRRVGNAVRPARKALDLPAEPAAAADSLRSAALAAEPQAVRRHAVAMMSEIRGWRFGAAALLALLPSALLLWQGITDHLFTEAEIAGGAPEDLLGFGLWPVLLPVGTIAAFLLLWIWRRVARGIARTIVAAEAVLFVASAVFAIWSYELLKARVFR